MEHVKINVTKEDIKPLLYFIISMFQQETIHRQGTSSKSDLIGGFIDRWINKIPEDLIFRKHLLLNKNYSVINDYFVYGMKSKKNAPDILGLQIDDQIIKFTEYNKNEWVQIEGMPHIEIKTFRKNQRLVSVRDTQLEEDHYYIFVESNFDNDYLIHLFDEQYLERETLNKISMSNQFIKDNSQQILIQPPEISIDKKESIGTLEIITIIKGSEFKKRSTLCKEKENVFFFIIIVEAPRVQSGLKTPKKFKEIFQYNSETDMYEAQWESSKMIPIDAQNIDELEILKINKGSFYCKSSEEFQLYNYNLKAGVIYKVELEIFQRNSGWNEYVALKNQFPEDINCEAQLVILLDEIANNMSKN